MLMIALLGLLLPTGSAPVRHAALLVRLPDGMQARSRAPALCIPGYSQACRAAGRAVHAGHDCWTQSCVLGVGVQA